MRPLFIDVELSRAGALYGLGALGPDGQEVVAERAADVPGALRTIVGWGADLLVGHNLARHDRPWLARYAPGHPALALPWADTLVLSPLAFPERPYHRLIKEHRLVRESLPAPLADCRATREVFEDARRALGKMPAALLNFVRAALTDPRVDGSSPGYHVVLAAAGAAATVTAAGAATVTASGTPPSRPADRHPPDAPTLVSTLADTLPPLRALLAEHACTEALAALTADPELALPLAYVAAWMRVPPGSTLPAWTRAAWPQTRALLDALRGGGPTRRGCGVCAWCMSHTPEGWLKRLFDYDAFRPTPASPRGGSLQAEIVAAGMADAPLYAVLPTGTGKSLCFQIPAAARHRRTGALTVAISPLQSLMKDQVDQLGSRDPHATTVNGSLTPPERARALEQVRDGWTSLVYVSPEQLRNVSVRRALATRTIGAWVIDEAHCLTDWGHDFRTDYLYVPRFARELAEAHGLPVPPFQCFTGTSQAAVTEAIRALLRVEVGQDLELFDGGAERVNLTFAVEERPAAEKKGRMLELLETHLTRGEGGAAIIFCASRRQTEEVALLLAEEQWAVKAYHAGLDAQVRREVQDDFQHGALQIIAATSAFGMGVDKPNVRLVVHLEVPGSLEAYLQQAGRAGRDGDPATCVLLFEPGDVDSQFRMASMGALTLRDLQALWRGLQRVPSARPGLGLMDERVVTRGELARLDVVSESFAPQDPMTETRITSAVSWLERAGLFTRDENHTHVFQGKPSHASLEAAMERVTALALPPARHQAWHRILARLFTANPDEGLTADDLAELAGADDTPLGAGTRVLGELDRMMQAGLVTGGALLSAFIAWGVANSTRERAARLVATQAAFLAALPELSNGADTDEWLAAAPELIASRLKEEHGLEVDAARVLLLLRALERDGLGLSDQAKSLDLRFVRRGHLAVRARRPWSEIERLGKLRAAAIGAVIDTLEALAAKAGVQGNALLVGFEMDTLVHALEGSLLLTGQVRSGTALVDQVLLLLHDARVLTIHGGLSVFRQAMVLRRRPDAPRTVRKEAVEPLLHHQEQRTLQIHVMGEYARVGAAGIDRAQALTRDWFAAPQDVFLKRWFPGRLESIRRATSPESYRKIVDDLDPKQREVVTTRVDANLLVLAGPGSGKTRVLVHRVAWLVRVKRVRPEGILVVCYTRANAIELRRRLRDLIEKDARGVTVTTLHGLALRLTGRSPEGEISFDGILDDALAILRGQRATEGADADELRDLALRGATHLLVDEYQDLDERQVRLLEAIAGRTHPDTSQRLAMLAVGDDDQSIFGWRGGSARWVREFGAAWSAEQHTLTTCYRCPRPVLDAATVVIAPVEGRLKAGTTLVPRKQGVEEGGEPVRRWWARPEEVGPTVVALVGTNVTDVAVLARTRAALAPVRAALEAANVPVAWPLAHDEGLPLPRVREVVRVLDALGERTGKIVSVGAIDEMLGAVAHGEGPWRALLDRWRDDVLLSHGEPGALGGTVLRMLWELLATERGERTLGHGVRLGTLHGAKGLEWPRVILVDDGAAEGGGDRGDEARRLWYVGITRAAHRLDLVVRRDRPHPLLRDLGVEQAVAVPQEGAVEGRPGGATRVRYELLGLDEVWIDGLGRDPDASGHRVLEALPYGAPVALTWQGGRGLLVAEGVVIARLTKAAAETWGARGATLRFVAAIRRTADQCAPEWRVHLRREAWWVPICEGRWEG